MKLWRIVKRHKLLTSWLLSFAVIVSILGVSVAPATPNRLVSVGGNQKYEITIGEKVLAAGLSADYTCINPSLRAINIDDRVARS